MRPNNSHLFQVFGFHQSTGKRHKQITTPCFPHAGLLQCTMSMPPTLGSSLIPGCKRWQQHSCLQEPAPGWGWHPVLPWTLGKSECTLTHWDTLRISKLNQQLQWAKHNIRHRECVLNRIVFGICIWLVFFHVNEVRKNSFWDWNKPWISAHHSQGEACQQCSLQTPLQEYQLHWFPPDICETNGWGQGHKHVSKRRKTRKKYSLCPKDCTTSTDRAHDGKITKRTRKIPSHNLGENTLYQISTFQPSGGKTFT